MFRVEILSQESSWNYIKTDVLLEGIRPRTEKVKWRRMCLLGRGEEMVEKLTKAKAQVSCLPVGIRTPASHRSLTMSSKLYTQQWPIGWPYIQACLPLWNLWAYPKLRILRMGPSENPRCPQLSSPKRHNTFKELYLLYDRLLNSVTESMVPGSNDNYITTLCICLHRAPTVCKTLCETKSFTPKSV